MSPIPQGNMSHAELHREMQAMYGVVSRTGSDSAIARYNRASRLHAALQHNDTTHPAWDLSDIERART